MKTVSAPSDDNELMIFAWVLVLAVGLWLVLRLLKWVLRRRGSGKKCKLRRHPREDRGNLRAWNCKTCLMVAYSATGKAPVECKRASRPSGL